MTHEFFKEQVSRLRTRFGEKAFDDEFVKLAWLEVGEMSDLGFKRTCDTFIGSKPWSQPPLLADFREARLTELRSQLKTEVATAARALFPVTKKTANEVLRPFFGEVTGVLEAWSVARRRGRGEGA
jgi:hypothetical protein